MTGSVSVTAKSRTITNGTANDGSIVEAEMVELYNNDSALATGVNAVVGSESTKGAIDGKFLIARNSFAGTPANGEHCGLEIERGGSTNVQLRWNETLDYWEFTQDGTNYHPLHPVVSSDPASPIDGDFWFNSTLKAWRFQANGATFTNTATRLRPELSSLAEYTVPLMQGASSVTITANWLYHIPIYLYPNTTISKMAIEVTTGVAGNARLGIYKNTNGLPSTLVLDAGTVSTATTGIKAITGLSTSIIEGGWYWVSIVANATPNIAHGTFGNFPLGTQSGAFVNSMIQCVYESFAYAALPSTATPASLRTTNVPIIGVA